MSANDLDRLLKEYEKQQKEFEQHWLWEELGTTPHEFFEKMRDKMRCSGISTDEWERRLADLREQFQSNVNQIIMPLDRKVISSIRL